MKGAYLWLSKYILSMAGGCLASSICPAGRLRRKLAWRSSRPVSYTHLDVYKRQGIIFNLQNNYGWRQKQEVELGEQTRKSAAAENLSLQEKLAVIAQVAEAARSSEDGADDEPN